MKKKKSNIVILLCFSLFLAFNFSLSSCAKKIGCPVNEQAHGKPSKKPKAAKTNLFPKKMRKN